METSAVSVAANPHRRSGHIRGQGFNPVLRGCPRLGATIRGRRSPGRSQGHDGCEPAPFGLRSRLHQHPLQGLLLVQVFRGDVSARGSKLTRSKWPSVLQQFRRLLGPFLGLPFHVILGDRDIGDCSDLNVVSVNWIASNLPGLDSAGCGVFEIGNISFVSLNAMALLCGHNSLRFSVEKVIERESIDLRMDGEQQTEVLDGSSGFRLKSGDLGWRENVISSGSGPVLLLHFPLHCTENCNFWGTSADCGTSKHSCSSSTVPECRGSVGAGPYDLLHTLSPNATEYIFQALKPRMIFSAHSHKFCDRTHLDGTREVTVPAMSWDARNDPAFVVATFKRNGRIAIVRHCSLAKESNVLIAYLSLLLVFSSTILLTKSSHVISSGS
ncbi:uncharacterized protein LOC131329203 isoform X2 [Rhododendron vialii]|uniref:uncharacterized protein LOC131329203 isoform X2 n=1 Tax=Rhododendron vialii TaxID=182163 RepID=UPI00265E8F25|nr:uncharacterized protein LOC131329203 isoform X2 [Rhododendron vialii]